MQLKFPTLKGYQRMFRALRHATAEDLEDLREGLQLVAATAETMGLVKIELNFVECGDYCVLYCTLHYANSDPVVLAADNEAGWKVSEFHLDDDGDGWEAPKPFVLWKTKVPKIKELKGF